ncbi:MAG: restriction endonuclease subunit S [Anaerotignum faecicola]
MKTVIRPETEMKDSGIEWIGNIPNDWKVSRVGNFFSFSSGDSLTNEDIRDDGMYLVYGANGIRGYYFKYNLDKKRILLGRVGALAGNVHIVDEKVWVTEHALIASDKLNLVEEYYGYVFESMNLIQYSKSSAQPVISGDTLQKLRFPVPELSEQQAIADYLDETCSKIDEIIAEAKASIEEYKELKQSILFETMTRGIQSDRKYKTCDYEWLGKVPEDWSLMKITHILDDNDSYPIGDGDHGLIKTDSYKSEGIPYIRVQNIGWGTPLLMDNVVYISKEDNERIKGSQLKPGDVLFVKTGATIGKTAIVPNNIPISNTTSHVGKITVSKEHNSKYIFYLLSSFIGYKQFWDIACMKATRPELSISEIKQMKVLIPSTRDEEDEIVEYLDNKLPEYETLICIKESLINDLEAYKKSLIYEVVTGKRRVV